MAKEIHLGLKQVRLSWVAIQLRPLQRGQDRPHIFAMLVDRIGPNNNIIQVDVANFANVRAQCGSHTMLVNGWGIP
jgi:hypothetical protein